MNFFAEIIYTEKWEDNGMTLEVTKQEAILKLETKIQGSRDTVWQLLTTTPGYQQWFSEIKAENLPESGELFFEAEGYKESLKLYQYRERECLQFDWAGAIVQFALSGDEETTTVKFQENAPLDFPNLARDLAGWTLQLQHLKAAAEKQPYHFDNEEFTEWMTKYGQDLVPIE